MVTRLRQQLSAYAAFVGLAVAPLAVSAQQLPIEWKKLAPQPLCAEPLDSANRPWFDPSFDDSEWQEARLPEFGNGTATSVFYRGVFSAPTGSSVGLAFSSDDGFSFYLNGQPVAQVVTPQCPSPGCTNLPNQCGSGSACLPLVVLSPNELLPGANQIAIHNWNAQPGSQFFDLHIFSSHPGPCWNCSLDPGEVCDPTVGGSPCSATCGLCGNGVTDAGEDCDDGNTLSGDCCTPTCRISSCDDGLFCNGAERCSYNHRCIREPSLCRYACDETASRCVIPSCPASPESACTTAQTNALQLSSSGDHTRDLLKWKWGGGEGQPYAGQPRTATEYGVCIYAGTPPQVVAQAIVPPNQFRWKQGIGDRYKYVDSNASADGISKIILRQAIRTVAPRMQVQGRGEQLPDISLPLSFPVTAQLITSEPSSHIDNCWGATFTSADAVQNDGSRFRAKRK